MVKKETQFPQKFSGSKFYCRHNQGYHQTLPPSDLRSGTSDPNRGSYASRNGHCSDPTRRRKGETKCCNARKLTFTAVDETGDVVSCSVLVVVVLESKRQRHCLKYKLIPNPSRILYPVGTTCVTSFLSTNPVGTTRSSFFFDLSFQKEGYFKFKYNEN